MRTMTSSARQIVLASTSVLALGVSAGFAAEPALLPDGGQVMSEDGRILMRHDDGSYEFVDKRVLEAAAPAFDGSTSRSSLANDPDTASPAATKPRAVSGTLAVYAGGVFLDGTDFVIDEINSQHPLFGGTGTVDIPFSEEWSLQLDVSGENAFAHVNAVDSTLEESYSGQAVLGGHLNYREVNDFLVGVFAGGGLAFQTDSATTDGRDAPVVTAGVEGQLYFDDLTAYGQAGWVHSTQAERNEVLEHAWFIRGVGRYYLNQGMTKLAAEGGFAQGERNNGSNNVDIASWGVEGEHLFHGWGADGGYASLFLRYEGRHFDETTTLDKYFEHTVMVGVRFGFNQMSLLSAERTGPAVDLPNVARWASGTILLD